MLDKRKGEYYDVQQTKQFKSMETKTKGVDCIKSLDPKKMSKKFLRSFTTNIFNC